MIYTIIIVNHARCVYIPERHRQFVFVVARHVTWHSLEVVHFFVSQLVVKHDALFIESIHSDQPSVREEGHPGDPRQLLVSIRFYEIEGHQVLQPRRTRNYTGIVDGVHEITAVFFYFQGFQASNNLVVLVSNVNDIVLTDGRRNVFYPIVIAQTTVTRFT